MSRLIAAKEKDLSLALKVQMLRETDLQDLQERYDELMMVRNTAWFVLFVMTE